MNKLTAAFLLTMALAAGALAGSWATAKTGKTTIPILVASPGSAAPSKVSFEDGFAPVVNQAVPAVVNVSSSRIVRNQGGSFLSPFSSDPFLRQFFGNGLQIPPSTEREHALGSGVIVNPDGYILTNNHVINGVKDIKVLLSDKRQFQARLVGADSRTDLAVLKVDANNLPVMTFGDSSKLQVGNFVLAIGKPVRLESDRNYGNRKRDRPWRPRY